MSPKATSNQVLGVYEKSELGRLREMKNSMAASMRVLCTDSITLIDQVKLFEQLL